VRQDPIARPGISRRAPLQQVANPQHQLTRLERLRKIIVGALLQPVDAILGLRHRGQQQHRDSTLPAQLAGQPEAILPRHHDIEHDEIESKSRQVRPRLPGIPGGRHSKAAIRQIPAQKLSQAHIVIHDQQMGLWEVGLGLARHAARIRYIGSQRIADGLSKRRRSSSAAMIPSSTVRKASIAAVPACR